MRGRRNWPRVAGCLLFMLCFALSRSAAIRLEGLADLRILPLEGAGMTGQRAWDMQELEALMTEPLTFAVWGQQDGQTLENPELARSAQATVLLIEGSSGLVLPESAPLLPEDTESCLLDEASALALFGDPAPVGSQLEFAGRRLTVRGIVPGSDALLAVRPLSRDVGLGYVTLQIPEGLGAQEVLDRFQYRHGVSGLWTAVRGWTGLGQFLSLLPAFVPLLTVVFSLLRRAFSRSEYPLEFIAFLLAAGAVWFAALWICGFSLQVPLEMLPGKWSDFDFWARLFSEKKAELLAFLTGRKTLVHLLFLVPALQAGGLGILAALLFPVTLCRARPSGGRALWMACGALGVFCFFAALFLSPALARDRCFWLAAPAYLLAFSASQGLRFVFKPEP